MPRLLLKICTIFLFCIQLHMLQAQETIPASGGVAYHYTGSAEYTVGQIIYTTISETTCTMAQGIQQPYKIFVESEQDEAGDIILTSSVYPNPVIDFLTLEVKNSIDENISFSLYSANGKLLKTGRVEVNFTLISMSGYDSATYYLKVTQEKNSSLQKNTRVFKIVKNRK